MPEIGTCSVPENTGAGSPLDTESDDHAIALAAPCVFPFPIGSTRPTCRDSRTVAERFRAVIPSGPRAMELDPSARS